MKRAVDRIEAGGRKPAAFICDRMPGCGGQVLLRKKNLNWSAMFAGWCYTRGWNGLRIAIASLV